MAAYLNYVSVTTSLGYVQQSTKDFTSISVLECGVKHLASKYYIYFIFSSNRKLVLFLKFIFSSALMECTNKYNI